MELDLILHDLFHSLCLASLIFFIYFNIRRSSNENGNTNQKSAQIQMASGALPLLGHALKLIKNPSKFLEECYHRHGEVFSIQFCRKKIIYICSHSLLLEYFSSSENKLSLIAAEKNCFIDNALSESIDSPIQTSIPIIKKSLVANIVKFSEAQNELVKAHIQSYIVEHKWKSGEKKQFNMSDFLLFCYHRPIFKNLFGFQMSDNVYELVCKISYWIDISVYLTYVVPNWVVSIMSKWTLLPLRRQYISQICAEVSKYFVDPKKKDSILLQVIGSYILCVNGANHRKLSINEGSEFMLNIHWVFLGNPGSLVAMVIKELVTNRPDIWKKLAEFFRTSNQSENVKKILKNELLHATVMEAARVNTQIAIGSRVPSVHTELGDYNVGNANYVLIPGKFMMAGEGSSIFKNAKIFNPYRFLEGEKEPMDSGNLWIWGSGKHPCPGRLPAINAAKISLAYIIQYFDIDVISVSPKNYLTTNIFPLQAMQISVSKV